MLRRILLGLFFLWLLLYMLMSLADASVIIEHDITIVDIDGVEFTIDSLADSIYKAEGAERAVKPFGILSVNCNGYDECRTVCKNTILNNLERYKLWGYKEYPTYLEFLASRYAPVGVDNDPRGLNVNWLGNVRALLAN